MMNMSESKMVLNQTFDSGTICLLLVIGLIYSHMNLGLDNKQIFSV